MMHPLLGIGAVLGILIGLLKAVRRCQRHVPLHPELARKLLHIGMGLTALSFPWLFDQRWPLMLLAAISMSAMWALNVSSSLKRHFGGVLDRVARRTYGEIYFPAGVLIAFLVAGERPALYCIVVLLLTLADPAAALVGTWFGRRAYAAPGGRKTLEGSGAFLTVAFLALLTTLPLISGRAGLENLLQAALLAVILTMVEAGAWAGSDNLLIPAIGVVCIPLALDLSLLSLWIGLCLTVLLVSLLMVNYRSIRYVTLS